MSYITIATKSYNPAPLGAAIWIFSLHFAIGLLTSDPPSSFAVYDSRKSLSPVIIERGRYTSPLLPFSAPILSIILSDRLFVCKAIELGSLLALLSLYIGYLAFLFCLSAYMNKPFAVTQPHVLYRNERLEITTTLRRHSYPSSLSSPRQQSLCCPTCISNPFRRRRGSNSQPVDRWPVV